MSAENWLQRASGLWLPRFANPLGRWGVCPTPCCGFSPTNCEECGNQPVTQIWCDIPALTDSYCFSCASYAGTYACTPLSTCVYEKQFTAICGFGLNAVRVWYEYTGGTCYLWAWLYIIVSTFPNPFYTQTIRWRTTLTEFADPIDHQLSYYDTQTTGGNPACTAVGTTVDVYE